MTAANHVLPLVESLEQRTLLSGVPVVSVTAANPMTGELADSPARFLISAAAAEITAPVIVRFTLSGTAKNGKDYAAITERQVTLYPEQSSVAVMIDPLDDLLLEGQEQVVLKLSSGRGYSLNAVSKSASVTILDNEKPVVAVIASSADAIEKTGKKGVFTISRTGPTTEAVQINFTVGGSAQAGTDYAAIGTSIMMPAKKKSVQVNVLPINNALAGGGNVTLSLSENAAFTLSSSTASATISVIGDDYDLTNWLGMFDGATIYHQVTSGGDVVDGSMYYDDAGTADGRPQLRLTTDVTEGDFFEQMWYSYDSSGLYLNRYYVADYFDVSFSGMQVASKTMQVGQTYRGTGSYDRDGSSGSAEVSVKFVGLETVRTPAGNYLAARIARSIKASDDGGSFSRTDTIWYAEGIGIVKDVAKLTLKDGGWRQTMSGTLAMTSYYIPNN